MRNFLKHVGLIALVTAIVFTMTACEDIDDNGGGGGGGGDGGGGVGGGGGGSGGPTFLGATLVISGEQVYTEIYNSNSVTYSEYNDDFTIEDDELGTVTITGGKFSYTIETPDNLENIKYLFGYDEYDDDDNPYFDDNGVTVSNANAKFYSFWRFFESSHDSITYTTTEYNLSKSNYLSYNTGNTSSTMSSEGVFYVYVDSDVTISRKEKTNTGTAGNKDGTKFNYTQKRNAFNLALKTGWNVLHIKFVETYTYPAGGNYNNITNTTNTETISLNNPSSLKWVLEVDEW